MDAKASPLKSRCWWTGLLSHLKGYLLISPAIALLCIFTIYPIFWLIHSSLYDGSLISKKRNFIGLGNFTTLWNSIDFSQTVWNTVIYSVGLVIALMILSTLVAVWLNGKMQKRLNSLTLAAIFTPHIISLVSVSTIFLWLFDPKIGAINYVLTLFGLPNCPFLASSKTALFSLVLMMIWKGLGYYTLLTMAALQGVPKEIYEATAIDDVPKIRVFFRITLPMISPTLFFSTIVCTINSFQVFETVNLMTMGGPVNSTNTLVFQIYSDAFKYLRLGLASAEGVVLLAFVVVLTVVYFAFLGKRVHYQ
ncbi:MAG TPA: sugar ABC transporter permease [Candidatus Limiplasma sp.]|nr:sugar ABC transporter permease [Candidatus Limiplasma sp.]